jgi:sulfatase modifying factor 1
LATHRALVVLLIANLASGCLVADASRHNPRATPPGMNAGGASDGGGGSVSASQTTTGGAHSPDSDAHVATSEFAQFCDPDLYWTPNTHFVTEAPGEGGCPAGMVAVVNYCVDKYEASLVYADTGESFSPFHNPGSTKVRALSVAGAVPQAYIDGIRAGEACAAAGKRLCTDDEWLRACRGPDSFTYPYGDQLMEGLCNDHRAVHPAIEYFGTDASWIWSELDNACIDQQADTVARAGSHAGCVTAEGAYDMMGNVHEWTADPAGTFRGGYYVDTKINGPGCLYVTTAHASNHWDYSTGFRCCADRPSGG